MCNAPFQGQDLTAYRRLGSTCMKYTRNRQHAQGRLPPRNIGASLQYGRLLFVVFAWCLFGVYSPENRYFYMVVKVADIYKNRSILRLYDA
jgi:hypothetical protein